MLSYITSVCIYPSQYKYKRPQLIATLSRGTARRPASSHNVFRRESTRGGWGSNEFLLEAKDFFCGRDRSGSTIDCRLFGMICEIWDCGLSCGVTIEEVLDVGDLEV